MHAAVAQNCAMYIGSRTLTQQANMRFVTRKIATCHKGHGTKRTITIEFHPRKADMMPCRLNAHQEHARARGNLNI